MIPLTIRCRFEHRLHSRLVRLFGPGKGIKVSVGGFVGHQGTQGTSDTHDFDDKVEPKTEDDLEPAEEQHKAGVNVCVEESAFFRTEAIMNLAGRVVHDGPHGPGVEKVSGKDPADKEDAEADVSHLVKAYILEHFGYLQKGGR